MLFADSFDDLAGVVNEIQVSKLFEFPLAPAFCEAVFVNDRTLYDPSFEGVKRRRTQPSAVVAGIFFETEVCPGETPKKYPVGIVAGRANVSRPSFQLREDAF